MKSNLLRLSFFVAILSFMVSCTTDDNSSSETPDSTVLATNYEYSPVELETMTLINDYRASKGLKRLEKINYISVKSEEHDNYMIANNVVNHDDFDARSTNIIKVLKAKEVSENIAYNYNSAKGAFDAWLLSDSHRKNIEGDYTNFGISVRENPANGKKYYTNIFVKI